MIAENECEKVGFWAKKWFSGKNFGFRRFFSCNLDGVWFRMNIEGKKAGSKTIICNRRYYIEPLYHTEPAFREKFIAQCSKFVEKVERAVVKLRE